MPGLTDAEAKATLDARFPTSGATDHVGWSTNGSTETTIFARTPVGATGWQAATTANPSVKANANVLTSAAASGAASNAAAISFPTATASWGTVTHYALFDAASSGNMLRWAALTASKTIGSGDTASFAIGALQMTED